MIEDLKKVWQYRELMVSLVSRELKIRYKNSVLGFLWSIISPLMTVLVISFIFSTAIGAPVKNFSVYILAAYLPYLFFMQAIMDATGSILANLGLIRKIYFPREILPIAMVISNFIHLLLALGVFFVLLLVVFIRDPRVVPFQATSLYLPILLIISFILASGLGLLFSAVNTFYEDVKYIVGFVMQMLLFASPIMWLVEKIAYTTPRRYLALNLLNPIGVICNGFRKMLVAPQNVVVDMGAKGHGLVSQPSLPIDWRYIGYAGLLSVAIFFVGYAVFNRYKWKFVERP